MVKLGLEQSLTSWLSNGGTDSLKQEDSFKHTAVFLSKVLADPSNPRFLPAIMISMQHNL
jgi:hypothetical protein